MAFIVFEGGEGVGKTTQLERLHKLLEEQNFAVLKTREPGGTPLAEKIRNLFKEKNEYPPLPLTEIYLLSAARNEHIQNIILPALAQKKVILCDRFLDSTYVYQCVVGGISKKLVDDISRPAVNNLVPDLTFIFYCDANTAQSRIQQESARVNDRYDSASLALKSKLIHGYKTIYDEKYTFPNGQMPKRILIDATQTIEDIFALIVRHVKSILS